MYFDPLTRIQSLSRVTFICFLLYLLVLVSCVSSWTECGWTLFVLFVSLVSSIMVNVQLYWFHRCTSVPLLVTGSVSVCGAPLPSVRLIIKPRLPTIEAELASTGELIVWLLLPQGHLQPDLGPKGEVARMFLGGHFHRSSVEEKHEILDVASSKREVPVRKPPYQFS